MKLTLSAGNKYVLTSSYDERDIPKRAGFRWDPERKTWWTADPVVASKLAQHASPEVRATLVAAQAAHAAAVELSRATTATINIPAPDGLDYLPFQRAGIAYASSRSATLIADEMGLGKTIQAIGLVNADPHITRVLVICPASLRVNWERELRRWLTRPLTIGVANGAFPAPEIADVVVINYDILKKHHDALRAASWDLIIIDECHYAKNSQAQRTQEIVGKRVQKEGRWGWAVEPLQAKRRLLLTGTPILNKPIELFTLLHYLDPQEWPSIVAFGKRYCDGYQSQYGWDFTGSSHLDELQDRLRSTVMVRRLKADVLTELPAKRRQVIELPVPNAAAGRAVAAETAAFARHESELYRLRLVAELAKAAGSDEEYRAAVGALREGAKAAFDEIARLRHDTARAKVPAVVEHLRDCLEAGSKVVVMAHHHDVQDAILAEFPGVAVLHRGGLSDTAKQEAVDRFQSDDSIRLFIGSIQASGVGITLTASAHVVFAELDWVPGNITQAEDRCHRIGQRESVLVQHLVLNESLDARMAHTLVNKQAVIASALDTGAWAPETSDDAPVVPDAGRAPAPATASISRAEVCAWAPAFTPVQVSAIHASLRILAGMDMDRAAELNGVGYNKLDTDLGHSLAGATRLTQRQAVLGLRLVRRYRRQLPEGLLAAALASPDPTPDPRPLLWSRTRPQ